MTLTMEYNTTRNNLMMREYGRHVQKMIEHTLSIEDERRQRNARGDRADGFSEPHLKNGGFPPQALGPPVFHF